MRVNPSAPLAAEGHGLRRHRAYSSINNKSISIGSALGSQRSTSIPLVAGAASRRLGRGPRKLWKRRQRNRPLAGLAEVEARSNKGPCICVLHFKLGGAPALLAAVLGVRAQDLATLVLDAVAVEGALRKLIAAVEAVRIVL